MNVDNECFQLKTVTVNAIGITNHERKNQHEYMFYIFRF